MAAGSIVGQVDPNAIAAGLPDPTQNPIEVGAVPPPPGVAPGAPPIATVPAAGAAPAPAPLSPPAPAGAVSGAPLDAPPAAGGKRTIPTGPATPPKFDPKKLATANNTLDLLNAMTPKSRTSYMTWWESQHGDINDRYDHLQQQLGTRPPTDQPMSKKEKFAELLQFGLHLMRNSAAPSTNQGAVLEGTLSDSVDQANRQHAAAIAGEQRQYDENANAIERGREADMKGIGTLPQAMALDQRANLAAQEAPLRTAQALETGNKALGINQPPRGPFTFIQNDKNEIFAVDRGPDGKVRAEPLGIAGRVLGHNTGSGVRAGADTAQMRNFGFLTTQLHIPSDVASQIAFRVRSGSPTADHLSVYNSVLRATMGDTAAASKAADAYVSDEYGAQALAGVRTPIVPPPGPPPAAFAGLKPGMVRRFKDGSAWTVGKDGKPMRLNTPPPAVLK